MVTFNQKIDYKSPPDFSNIDPKMTQKEEDIITLFMIPKDYIPEFLSIIRSKNPKTKLFFLQKFMENNVLWSAEFIEGIWDILGHPKYFYDVENNCYDIFEKNNIDRFCINCHDPEKLYAKIQQNYKLCN